MQEAVADAGLGRGDVKAIGIANQRETTVVWERSTDTSVHPTIVWQSRQTAPQCELMTRAGLEATIRERTGLVIDPYFSGSKIRWILERYPDTIEKARSGELLFHHRHLVDLAADRRRGARHRPDRTPRARCSTTSTTASGTPCYWRRWISRGRCSPRCGRARASSAKHAWFEPQLDDATRATRLTGWRQAVERVRTH